MLDVRKLRSLREVALRGSFSAAAQSLSYTQSAVSQQIAQLERQAGVRLLERRGRTVTLTPAGRALVQRTEVVLIELEEAEAELDALAGVHRDSVRLAVSPPSLGTWVPAAIRRLRHRCPETLVSVSIVESGAAVEMVESRDVDIGVVAGVPVPTAASGTSVTPLLDEPLYLALPARHPKAGGLDLGLADLADELWILPAGVDGDLARDICRRAGFTPRITVRTDDPLAAQGLVASGLGVTMLTELECAVVRRDDITLRPMGISRPVSAITAGSPNTVVEAMLEELRRAAAAWPAIDTHAPEPGDGAGQPVTSRAVPEAHVHHCREATDMNPTALKGRGHVPGPPAVPNSVRDGSRRLVVAS